MRNKLRLKYIVAILASFPMIMLLMFVIYYRPDIFVVNSIVTAAILIGLGKINLAVSIYFYGCVVAMFVLGYLFVCIRVIIEAIKIIKSDNP